MSMSINSLENIGDTRNRFRFKNVLLVNPPYPGSMERGTLRSGMGYLAEALRQGGVEYDVIDMDLGYEESNLIKKINDFRPDLVGVSMMTYRYAHTYRLLQSIKKTVDVSIVVGGPHICALEDKVLRECDAVDYGITGEGEEGLVELCRGKELEKIDGLTYRKKGDIVKNQMRSTISDLEGLAFPMYHKFELNKYPGRTISIVSSRGCPYRCIFCTISSSMGKKIRTRSSENVVDELEYWYGRGQRRFGIVDDNFTFFADRVYSICDEIEKRQLNGMKLFCGNGVRADRIDKELLKRMKDVGFCSLGIGVEGGNDRILENIKKGETMATIERAIRDACDLGYEVTLHFVIGTPGETMKDVEDTFAVARKYPVRNAYFNNLLPYPGTEIYEWVTERKCFLTEPAEYLDSISTWSDVPVFETPEFPKEERVCALKQAKLVTRKIRREYYSKKFEKLGEVASTLGWLVSFLDDIKGLLRESKWGKMVLRIVKPLFR